MYIKHLFGLFGLLYILTACAPSGTVSDWSDDYDQMLTSTPTTMDYGWLADKYGTATTDTDEKRVVAVLLPMSGTNASVGNTIRTSVETAVLQHAPKNLSVSFFDTSSNATDAINSALALEPQVIIGPVFSANARLLRVLKPEHIPAISFTSDATAVGDGVMTMALMPTNSIETIVRQMQTDNVNKFIILAPDTDSGRLMAGTAKYAGDIYNIDTVGIFYYNESDPESIKNTTISASMNTARTSANTRARAILADILTRETLTAVEKSNLNIQLDKLSKIDTLGPVPYNGILFLGNADDSMKLASFLRYYGVGARDAKMYGTAMWDGTTISSDITMSGAKYATLPDSSTTFAGTYQQISGTLPSRLASFGYDATNMAIGMLYSDKSASSYLLDPSGYVGTDGLFRLKPTGDNERGLRIIQLRGDGTTTQLKPAPENFMTPLYNIEQRHIRPASPMSLQTPGINPNNYISIPQRYASKYRSKTYGANMTVPKQTVQTNEITILPEDDREIITSENYKPVKIESIQRNYIDSYEIEE